MEDGEDALFPAELSEHWVLGYETLLPASGAGLDSVRVELYRRDVLDPRPRYENLPACRDSPTSVTFKACPRCAPRGSKARSTGAAAAPGARSTVRKQNRNICK